MVDFEEIFSRYYDDVYRFLMGLCNYNEDLAQEYTQETFYYAYLSFASFRGACQLKTWLIQIAKNRFYMALRRRKKQPFSLEQLPCEPCAEDRFEDEIAKRQLLGSARLIMDDMPANMRDVMLYRFFSDLSYQQIGAMMNLSESSAKVLFFRGKQRLRKKLKEDYGYEI